MQADEQACEPGDGGLGRTASTRLHLRDALPAEWIAARSTWIRTCAATRVISNRVTSVLMLGSAGSEMGQRA
jgi:hypothetical protein